MWPFSRPETLSDQVLSALEDLALRLNQLTMRVDLAEKRIAEAADAAQTITRAEGRILTLERVTKQLGMQRDEDVARLSASIDVVRGLATGGRGGRPPRVDPQVTQLGERVLAAMQSPQALQAFIAELQQLGGGGGPVPVPLRTNSPV